MKTLQRRDVVRGLVLLPWIASLAGCDDAPSEPERKVVAVKEPHKLPEWLTPRDKIDPSVWLRSREVGHDVLPSDPEVDRIRRAMSQAATRFYEDDRMIANRTAQTGDMLAETKQPERYVDIMTGMIDVADVTSHKQLYGEMCQHYLNNRKNGKDRAASLQQLSASYRAQNSMR